MTYLFTQTSNIHTFKIKTMKKLLFLTILLSLLINTNAQPDTISYNTFVSKHLSDNIQQEYYNMIHNVEADLTLQTFDINQYAKLRNTSKILEFTGMILAGASFIAAEDDPVLAKGMLIGGSTLAFTGWLIDWFAIGNLRDNDKYRIEYENARIKERKQRKEARVASKQKQLELYNWAKLQEKLKN